MNKEKLINNFILSKKKVFY